MAQRRQAAAFFKFIESNRRFGTTGAPIDGAKPYLAPDQLDEYWTPARIREAIGDPHYNLHHIDIVRTTYIRVFSVLVVIERAECIKDLMQDERFADSKLPFDSDIPCMPSGWPSNKEDFQRFCTTQWQFSVTVMDGKQLMSGLRFPEERILPYRKLDALKSGDTATTYRIEIDQTCNLIVNSGRSNQSPAQVYVLKVYRPGDRGIEKNYENEVQAFRRLVLPKRRVSNLITFYGSWRHGNIYNVLLEYASGGNLEQFFGTVPAPTRAEDILKFWERLFGIVEALVAIHETVDKTSPPVKSIGIHQDIKPANILVCRGQSGSMFDVVFKLADFGLSHFRRTNKEQPSARIKDAFGTPMYSAPECCRIGVLQHTDVHITSKVDIWSMGCVFSEAACYVVLGQTGRDDYYKLRKSQIPEHVIGEGYDSCFHDGQDVLSAVQEMHVRLMQERRVSDSLLERVLHIVSQMLDSNPAHRLNVNQVYKMCKNLTEVASADVKFPRAFRTAQDHAWSPSRRPTDLDSASSHKSPVIPRRVPPQLPPEVATPGQGSGYHVPATSHSPRPQRSSSHIYRRSPNMFGHTMRSIDEYQQGLRISTTESPISPSPETRRPYSEMGSPRPSVTFARDSHTNDYVSDEEADERDEDEEEHQGYGRPNAFGYSERPTSWRVSYRNGQQMTHHGSSNKDHAYNRDDQNHEEARSTPYVSVQEALTWTSTSRSKAHSAINNEIGKLAGRDHVFLVDDSQSMEAHRVELQQVFEALAKIAATTDPDGIDLYFTNSPTETHNDKKWRPLAHMIEKRAFTGDCDMKNALQNIFDDFTASFDATTDKPRSNKLYKFMPFKSNALGSSKKKKGLSVYVFTTGVWQKLPKPASGVEQPILNVVRKLNENKHLDTRIGVQFIQFGDHPPGALRLARLDHLQEYEPTLSMDIIDTTKSTDNVLKMLLGAFNRNWDDDDDGKDC